MKTKILIILSIVVIIFVVILNKVSFGKYESNMESKAKLGIAFYVIDSNYQVEEIKLDKLSPSNDLYTYEFSVANYNEEKMLEVDSEYHIVIRTTTNLNLEYELYKNNEEKSQFIKKEVVTDSDGMYYNLMETDKEIFSYKDKQINNYKLTVKFPIEYINYNYQDIMDSIEIIILSNQITE